MPTARRRLVTHRKRSPPVAHWSRTVSASSLITPERSPFWQRNPARFGRDSAAKSVRKALRSSQQAERGRAVDLEGGAAHEPGRLRAEEGDDPAEVGGVAHPRVAGITKRGHALGGVEPGAREVHSYAVAEQIGGRRLGPRPEARAGGVGERQCRDR